MNEDNRPENPITEFVREGVNTLFLVFGVMVVGWFLIFGYYLLTGGN